MSFSTKMVKKIIIVVVTLAIIFNYNITFDLYLLIVFSYQLELSVGKTQVIKVIQYYFLKTKIWILTYTANVTLFIKGTIIHYLLRFSIDKHININKFNTIIDIWPNIQFIIIDKISQVGCILLFTIHVKLQKLNPNHLSFERINVMFMRDFLQNFPINDTPLY